MPALEKWQRNRRNGVPREGDIAFSQGWAVSANPHEIRTVDFPRWISDWWRAYADGFESHVYGMAEEQEDRGIR